MNARFSLSMTLVLVLSLASASALVAGEDPVAPPPKDQDPTIAERGYFDKYPHAWNDFHKLFLERAKQGPIELLFIGDSILQGWGDAAQKDLWKANFETYKSANFSIGGDRTQQVLWRITNGELDNVSPKVIVLQIGSNNLWANDSAEKISDGIKKIVETIRKKLPNSKILLLGILPAQRSGTDSIREKIKQINATSASLSAGASVRVLDIGTSFLDSSGNADPDSYQADFVHLKTKGYETWAKVVKPAIAELLK